MSMQHEVTTAQKLLNEKGEIAEPGWAKSLIWEYGRDQIKAPKWRIKEWDYYLVVGKNHACAFTISDLGYIGMISVTLLDFDRDENHTNPVITVLPMGKFALPTDSSGGNITFKNKNLKLKFIQETGYRRILCQYNNLDGQPFKCDIRLEQPAMDSMVIATPWAEKADHFYYNQKINCMRAKGKATWGDREYVFEPENDYGTLDWGRGVWTYDNTWYWSSGNQTINGKPFGFNLGYGFSDRSSATENMLFYDGKAHKLDEVTFEIPVREDGTKDYMSPWKFTSNDGRFECDFVPVKDRSDLTKIGPILTDQHQVFGRLNGTATLDDGTVLEIKDMLMFAEDVHNKY